MSPPLDPFDGPAPAAPDPPLTHDPEPPAPAQAPDGADAANTTETPDAPDAPDTPEPPNDAGLIRDLILQAHPDVVPELIQGVTLHELLASLPAAQVAWRNAAERLRSGGDGAVPSALAIPSGASVRSTSLDPDALSPLAKIRAAVR